MIIFVIIAIIVAIAVPIVLHTRMKLNEKACIGLLRSFHSDQKTYKSDEGNYATLLDLRDPGKKGIPSLVGPPTIKAGYLFTDLIAAPSEDN